MAKAAHFVVRPVGTLLEVGIGNEEVPSFFVWIAKDCSVSSLGIVVEITVISVAQT